MPCMSSTMRLLPKSKLSSFSYFASLYQGTVKGDYSSSGRFNAVSSTIFSPVKGVVRAGNNFLHVFPYLILRKADGNGNLKIWANVWKQGIFDVGTHTLGADKCPFDIRMRQYDQEFLAAIASAKFRVAQAIIHHGGDCPQYRITCKMPMDIIDILEVVNIQHGQTEHAAAAR